MGWAGRRRRREKSLIKQTFTAGSITSSSELLGDQTQPPENTQLTHPTPKPTIVARKLGQGEYGEIMGLAPDSLSLLHGQPRFSPRMG